MKTHYQPERHVVVGLSALELTSEESTWLRERKPAGVILFRRNVASLAQLVQLIQTIRATAEPPPTIWIDQEGGRVQRIREPLTRFPTPSQFARLYQQNPPRATQLARLAGRVCGKELAVLGIGVNCAPVLDLLEAGADPVIGDRAFGDSPHTVIQLAGAWLAGFSGTGVMAVGKHFPGHGAASVDSHKSLPKIRKSRAELETREWVPFRELAPNLPALMTAHLVATAVDEEQPATWSRPLLHGVLRQAWRYSGLIVSDAIEMGALEGSYAQRAYHAIRAGCDLVLCCTGRLVDNEAAWDGAAQALATMALDEINLSEDRIERLLAPFRLSPGNWQELLVERCYRADRQAVEAFAEEVFDLDPTEGIGVA